MTVTVDVKNNTVLNLLRDLESLNFIQLEPPAAELPPQRKMSSAEAVEYCWGLGKRLGSRVTSDRAVEMRRKDKALEEAQYNAGSNR
jgi:hypothetical protein